MLPSNTPIAIDPDGMPQQPVDDLQRPSPVSGCRSLQRAGAALKRRRGHVIEHQRPLGQMPRGKGVFDGVFAASAGPSRHTGRPRHSHPRRAPAPVSWSRSRRGPARWPAGRGRSLGHRRCSHQIAERRASASMSSTMPSGVRCRRRRDVPVRQAAVDLKRLGQILSPSQAFQRGSRVATLRSGSVTGCARYGFHLALVAVAFAQQRRRGDPGAARRHVHACFLAPSRLTMRSNSDDTPITS